jgi:D-3-phosphoglycerate dehydrogenase
MRLKALISTVPFAANCSLPIDLLKANNIDYLVNPIGRKLSEEDLIALISDFDVLIAGTEPITSKVLEAATKLRLISRVGVGLDSVDLFAARERGIKVCNTPVAPAPAVAELSIALILNLLRKVHVANSEMHRGDWNRHFGRRVPEVVFGLIGCGKIGSRVLKGLQGLSATQILVNDILEPNNFQYGESVKFVDKETIYQSADVISLHLPLTAKTKNLICFDQLMMMKHDAVVINTSRGGIINEKDLSRVLHGGHLSGAAIDVFENEPYKGDLCGVERCLLTSHMGSMSLDCRAQMEIEATEEVIRFLYGQKLLSEVPFDAYELLAQGK